MARPADTRLLLDVMLGGLVSILRMVGYDTAYALDRGIEADEAILAWAEREDRLLLTRDVEVAERAADSLLLKELDPQDQLAELADAGFGLELTEPTRCSRCNGPLARVESGPGPEAGPDPTDERVWQCRDCGQFYWIGSHWEHLRAQLPD
ncbi:hypothetical protein HTSR_1409 [Halodesulfurarchaeum formicicum]|uniref:Mut7-C RNAse domain-containing protein n=1 Tax=Halodesulfurarchaeum formicicum TaxID=1873524 RepID=A0A1D8S5G8_9EURY|nr:Mut7-C RNAse domain-containing protein [Halodesulfurarchaeum formicicum]AOW80585.1 hypothetical protein HTSR_1409 [Halodesulfurarchaeum formicicum]APE95924.1 hypothetical protein HSR6_1481 [Halodesulfurarchaeum formicicum]